MDTVHGALTDFNFFSAAVTEQAHQITDAPTTTLKTASKIFGCTGRMPLKSKFTCFRVSAP
jgi:hypothetical protein